MLDVNIPVIILVIVVEGFLLGCMWSNSMVRKAILHTAYPRIVIISAVFSPLALLFILSITSLFGGFFSFSILAFVPMMIMAIMNSLYLISDNSPFQNIYRFIAVVPYTLVVIATFIYLGALFGVKLATTRPLNWIAFLTPATTAFVFFAGMPGFFMNLYMKILETVSEKLGHFGTIAFHASIIITTISTLFWLGIIFGRKVATVRSWLFVIFLLTIAFALEFFSNRQPWWILFYEIGQLIYTGFLF